MTDNRRPVKVAKIPLPMYVELKNYQKEIEDSFKATYGYSPRLTDAVWEWYIRKHLMMGGRR